MTEGCRGGWSIFNGYFAENSGLVTEKCAPYVKSVQACSKYARCPEVARVSKSYFLSDNSESGIQKELLKNGAVDANWNVPAAAYSYQSGVMTQEQAGMSAVNNGAPGHVSAIIGWGTDQLSKKKYWIVRNSWGT